jgi:hypothetical protein
MYIPVECPGCQDTIRVQPRHLGQTVTCPACAFRVVVPQEVKPKAAVPVAAAAEPSAGDGGPAPPLESEPILEFRAVVRGDPGHALAGAYRGVATAQGLQLWRGRELAAAVGLRTPARLVADNRLEVVLEGRPVEVAVSRWGLPQPELAHDLVGLLHGDRGALQPFVSTFNWPFLATLIPLGLPLLGLVREGSRTLGLALGLGLAMLCWFLARRERWSLTVRKWLVLSLDGLGYAVLLAVLLGGRRGEAPTAAAAEPAPAIPAGTLRATNRVPRDREELFTRRPNARMGGRPAPAAESGFVVRLPERRAAAGGLKPAGRIGAWLTLSIDPEAGAAFATGLDATLRHYRYPDFRLLGTYRLPEPVYLAELDARRRVLYAASSTPAGLKFGTLGDRIAAKGDLHAFDVSALYSGKKLSADALLRPLRTQALSGEVFSLVFSPDGERLHCLYSGPRGARVRTVRTLRTAGALNPPEWPDLGELFGFPGSGLGAMHATPGGRFLLIGWPGSLGVLDTRGEDEIRYFRVMTGARAGAMAADRFYVTDHGHGGAVSVVDLATRKVTDQFVLPVRGRVSLTAAPDGTRLFLSNWSAGGNGVYVLDVAGERATRPVLLGQAVSDDNGLIRGESVVSPDGRFLLNRAGRVFRVE